MTSLTREALVGSRLCQPAAFQVSTTDTLGSLLKPCIAMRYGNVDVKPPERCRESNGHGAERPGPGAGRSHAGSR